MNSRLRTSLPPLPPMKRLVLFLAAFALAPLALFAADDKKAAAPATPPAAPKLKQFIYVLRLVPRLHDDKAWTEADGKTGQAHFAHLTAATKAGKVILAGRTLESGDKTFGLVVFEAADEPAARAFMNSDPAVIGQIMTAELHPYQVALMRSPK